MTNSPFNQAAAAKNEQGENAPPSHPAGTTHVAPGISCELDISLEEEELLMAHFELRERAAMESDLPDSDANSATAER